MNNNDIQGSLSVSQGMIIGGDLTTRGNSTFEHNVKIKGWLDAKNIKGPLKGLFKDDASLKENYPEPQTGWYALVGNTLPANLYRAENGEWVATGEKGGEVYLSLDDLEQDVSEAQNDILELQTFLSDGVLVPDSLVVNSDANTASMTYRLKKQDGSTKDYTVTLPIASENNSGMMSASDKKMLTKTLDFTAIDLDTDTIIKIAGAQLPTRYVVTQSGKNVGTLICFSDNMLHMLTQVFTTHYMLPLNGSQHSDEKIFAYFRSYHLLGGTSDIPEGTWGDWKLVYSSDIDDNVSTLQESVSEIDKAVFPLGVTLSVSPTIVEAGTSTEVTISWGATLKGQSINDAANFTLNDTSVKGTTSKKETITDTAPTTKIYTLVTSYEGRSNTSKVNLPIVGAMYFGFNAANAVGSLDITSLGKESLKTSPNGTYTLQNSTDGHYMWLCVPNNMNISKVTMSGFDVPMEAAATKAVGDITYKCYRSSNALLNGSYTILIA